MKVDTAASHHYRRRTLVERLGDALAPLLPRGAVRDRLRAAYRGWLGRGARSLVCRLPGGESVRLLPECRYVTWNPREYDALRAATRPGTVALDVGANVGAYALVLGQWVRPSGRVVAFEPAPSAFDVLRRQLELNGLLDVVTPVQAAVTDKPGELAFVADGTSGTNHLAGEGDAGQPVVRVPATSIDAWCAAQGVRPGVIKIDVEGAELEVLRGARATIAAGGPGLVLLVEMHPAAWRAAGRGWEDLRAELDAQGLVARPLRPGVEPWALEGETVLLERATR